MSTNDVPGAIESNHDILHGADDQDVKKGLAMGSWAEHSDGSLIFVLSTEKDRVVFSMFDMLRDPIIEFRDAMPEAGFKKAFSWEDGKKSTKVKDKDIPMIQWTWHDKTPFPWDRVIKAGLKDGPRPAAAEHVKSAAERIAESLESKAQEFDATSHEHLIDKDLIGSIADKLARALNELRK